MPLSFRKAYSSQFTILIKKFDIAKLLLKIFQNKKIAEKFAVLSFQLNFCDQLIFHGFFFTNENPRKFVEKQNMIFFYIFHVYLDNSKRTITQGTSAPEDSCPGGILAKKIFPQETFVQKNPLCQGDPFFSKKISTSLEPLCNKEHPMTKHVVWGRVLTKQKSDTW